MKPLVPLLLLALIPTLSFAQTATAPAPTDAASPAAAAASPQASASPKRTPPPAVSTVTSKTPSTQPENRGGGWGKRVAGNIATSSSDAATIDIVFDGDSITDFWQKTGAGVWASAFASKYHPVDFGISGDTTENLLYRLAQGQAKGLHPKLILLMIGTNNMKFTQTPQDIADGVAEIIKQYQQICPDAVILLQAIFPRANLATDPYRLKVNATNPLLQKLADGTKVIWIDFNDKFLTSDGTLTKEIMPDYLHPSAKGYQIWADAVSPTIEKVLGH
jgi:lysophospholipase L1-like esterase